MKKRWAFLSVSRDGAALSRRCVQAMAGDADTSVYTLKKYADGGVQPYPGGKLGPFWEKAMADYDVLVCVMAAGIVVRGIAPYIRHKSKDPAVLVLDAGGRYVISLLSGHLGGANAAARQLAARIGAEPVITTGTDVAGSLAVDSLAQKINCTFTDFEAAKNVTALILDRKPVEIVNAAGIDLSAVSLPDTLTVSEQMTESSQGQIVISERDELSLQSDHQVQLIPRNVVLGIGCKKNTPAERITAKVKALLKAHHLHPKTLAVFATIGLKAQEQGLLQSADGFGAAVKIIGDDAVKAVQNQFKGSDFVEKITGLRCVSEPAGYIASGRGACIAPVVKGDGVTLSLWRMAHNQK
jgi:cobalt-precorrin 5A hydrolase